MKDEQKYKEKLLAKARIIADSANRLWRRLSHRHTLCFEKVALTVPEIEMREDMVELEEE